MNKMELISALQDRTGIKKGEAAAVVELFFNEMKEALTKGDRIEIRGLFSFFVKHHKGYRGRNPRSGDCVTVKPKSLPFFKCGRELKTRVNS